MCPGSKQVQSTLCSLSTSYSYLPSPPGGGGGLEKERRRKEGKENDTLWTLIVKEGGLERRRLHYELSSFSSPPPSFHSFPSSPSRLAPACNNLEQMLLCLISYTVIWQISIVYWRHAALHFHKKRNISNLLIACMLNALVKSYWQPDSGLIGGSSLFLRVIELAAVPVTVSLVLLSLYSELFLYSWKWGKSLVKIACQWGFISVVFISVVHISVVHMLWFSVKLVYM